MSELSSLTSPTTMTSASYISHLPTELMEKVFLHVIISSSSSRFRLNWVSLTLVNRDWSAVAFRMEFLRIYVQNNAQLDRLLERFKAVRMRGDERAPSRYLGINPPPGETLRNLARLLKNVGHSVEDLNINGNQSDNILPGLFVGAVLPTSWDSETVHLPVLRRLQCVRIDASDFLELLRATHRTIKSLRVLHSNVISSPVVLSLLGDLTLPALHTLSLHERVIPRPLPVATLDHFFKVSPLLNELHLSIGRSELPRTIAWLRENCPRTLKRLTLWIRVLDRSFNGTDEEVRRLRDLLSERSIASEIIAYLGINSWSI